MAYDFSLLKEKAKGVEGWLARELSSVRTGRATSAILDTVRVDSYGTKAPLSHVASISVEDAKTIRITPWDKGQNKELEKAIIASNLGLSVILDDQGLRIVFPELTAERREALRKVVNGKLEEARITLRKARDDAWQEIQERTRAGTLSEDDKFRSKEEMEKIISATGKKLEEMAERKEKEISK